MKQTTRRGLLKNVATAAVAATGAGALSQQVEAQTGAAWQKKAIHPPTAPPVPGTTTVPPAANTPAKPLFSGIVTFGQLVFIAGIGAHFPGTIEEHTKHVLDEIEKNLILAGSSMEKVLKVNVYLSDLANYTRMNAVYLGRFGMVPPVRTTIAVVNGVPGDSLVEIDCIASL